MKSLPLLGVAAGFLLFATSKAEAQGPGCAYKASVSACMACLKANGMAGASGGRNWCVANMKKAPPKKKTN